MVLGDGTRDRGAACDHINPDTPGVAYLKLDGVRDPVRFRAAEITDTDLHTLTHGLPSPRRPAQPSSDGGEESWPFDGWTGTTDAAASRPPEPGREEPTHVRVDVIDLTSTYAHRLDPRPDPHRAVSRKEPTMRTLNVRRPLGYLLAPLVLVAAWLLAAGVGLLVQAVTR